MGRCLGMMGCAYTASCTPSLLSSIQTGHDNPSCNIASYDVARMRRGQLR